MYLSKLKLVNFKNFENFEAEFSRKINSIVGHNGVGKTNILDSIYYLSFTKSYFSPTETQNIRHHESFMLVEGTYQLEKHQDTVLISQQRGSKKSVKRSGKQIDRLSDYAGTYPLVIVSPADRDLILDGSSLRRKFVDGVISQTNAQYLDYVLRHSKIIEQRNALLKSAALSYTQLDIYDEALVEVGEKIYIERKAFLESFVPVFKKIYADISASKETADIHYTSVFDSADPLSQLKDARGYDLALGFSTKGAHKDDLKFTLDGFPVKKYGSQGQQKTFLTALKLAQFSFMTSATGKKPILLLDDIFDKLDASRVQYIINLVNSETFGQIFISDTHPERIEELMRSTTLEHKIFTLPQ